MLSRLCLLLAIFLAAVNPSAAQSALDESGGMEFFISLPPDLAIVPGGSSPPPIRAHVATSRPTTVRFAGKPLAGPQIQRVLTANSSTVAALDVPRQFQPVHSQQITPAVHVAAGDLISLTVVNRLGRSTDAFSLLPVSAWGRRYIVASAPNDAFDVVTTAETRRYEAPGFANVMAAYDSTVVTIKPSCVIAAGTALPERPAGVSYTVVLNRGQVYTLLSSLALPSNDLTGTIITSSKPVSVIAGHTAGTWPQLPPSIERNGKPVIGLDLARSAYQESLLPFELCGTEYVVVPRIEILRRIYNDSTSLPGSLRGASIRCMAFVDGTSIRYHDSAGIERAIVLQAGQVHTAHNITAATSVMASHPIQCVSMLPTYVDLGSSTVDRIAGAPAIMSVEIPMHLRSNSIPRVPTVEGGESLLTFYGTEADLQDVTIDGAGAIPQDSIRRLPSSEYCYANIPQAATGAIRVMNNGRCAIRYEVTDNSYFGQSFASSFTYGLNFFRVSSNDESFAIESDSNPTCSQQRIKIVASSDFTPAYATLEGATNTRLRLSQSGYGVYVDSTITLSAVDGNRPAFATLVVYSAQGASERYRYEWQPRNTLELSAPLTQWPPTQRNVQSCSTLVVRNTGELPITILGIQAGVDARIAIDAPLPILIGAGEQAEVPVCVTPTMQREVKLGFVLVTECHSIELAEFTVEGLVPSLYVTPEIGFGHVPSDSAKSRMGVVKNTSALPIDISSITVTTLTTDGISRFFLEDPQPIVPQTIAAGDSIAIGIAFRPHPMDNATIYGELRIVSSVGVFRTPLGASPYQVVSVPSHNVHRHAFTTLSMQQPFVRVLEDVEATLYSVAGVHVASIVDVQKSPASVGLRPGVYVARQQRGHQHYAYTILVTE